MQLNGNVDRVTREMVQARMQSDEDEKDDAPGAPAEIAAIDAPSHETAWTRAVAYTRGKSPASFDHGSPGCSSTD